MASFTYKRTNKVLLIYTGGTIGMGKNPATGALEPLDFNCLVDNLPEFKYLKTGIEVYQFASPIDSSDMAPRLWAHLVGIIADNYLDDATMYAAPGTLSDVYRRIEGLTGIPQYLGGSLYWSAPSPEPVLAQLRVLNSISAALQELPAATSAQVLLSAADLHGDRPAPGGNPVIYVWPAVLMPALAVIMAILLLSVWLRKQQVTLAAMGIQDSALVLAIIGALTIMGLAALAVASPIALGISTIVRIILSRVYELPLSTFVFPWGLFPLFWLSIAGGIAAGLAIAGVWARRKRKVAVGAAGTTWVMGSISCLSFLTLSALFLFPDILDDQNQIVGASFVVMASALMALWLTKTRRLWPDSLAGVLSRRMKERDAFSGAITWLLSGAIVGIPLMLVTTAVTTENTMNLTQIDSVPPNTVRITMTDRLGNPWKYRNHSKPRLTPSSPSNPFGFGGSPRNNRYCRKPLFRSASTRSEWGSSGSSNPCPISTGGWAD